MSELFEFSSEEPSALAVDGATGALTLRANHPTSVTLSAASRCAGGALPAVVGTTTAFANLRPDAFGVDLGRTAQAQFGSPKAGGALTVDVRVRAPCSWSAVELSLYYHRDALTPTSSNPTDFGAAPAGAWVDNAGDNLAGTFSSPKAPPTSTTLW